MHFLQVEVKRALPKEVQQQQAALRAAVAGRGMLPAAIGELTIIQHACADRILKNWLCNSSVEVQGRIQDVF